jgi:hypothetical protein
MSTTQMKLNGRRKLKYITRVCVCVCVCVCACVQSGHVHVCMCSHFEPGRQRGGFLGKPAKELWGNDTIKSNAVQKEQAGVLSVRRGYGVMFTASFYYVKCIYVLGTQ